LVILQILKGYQKAAPVLWVSILKQKIVLKGEFLNKLIALFI
jgi:hypothetical protein